MAVSTGSFQSSFRLSLPRHERRHGWLSLLLDCYACIDASVAGSIAAAQEPVACHEGCTSCCRHSIPLSPLEALGLGFCVRELLPPAARAALQARQGQAVHPGDLCPFNLGGSCSVYALRPIACRRYLVCGQPCQAGESPLHTRPQAVLHPSRLSLRCAVALTMPFYAASGHRLQPGQDPLDFYLARNISLAEVWPGLCSGLSSAPAGGGES